MNAFFHNGWLKPANIRFWVGSGDMNTSQRKNMQFNLLRLKIKRVFGAKQIWSQRCLCIRYTETIKQKSVKYIKQATNAGIRAEPHCLQ